MAKRYDATKPLAIAGFHIRDSHMMNRWLNVPETLIHSSNIVTAQIGDQLGREKMEELFRSLGFDGRPHIELKERAFPLWPKSWGRSEEHTSELQSLMRISYAVFCLKKQKETNKLIRRQKHENRKY